MWRGEKLGKRSLLLRYHDHSWIRSIIHSPLEAQKAYHHHCCLRQSITRQPACRPIIFVAARACSSLDRDCLVVCLKAGARLPLCKWMPVARLSLCGRNGRTARAWLR